MAVVDEVAKREEIDPVRLSEPLGETINPDALDALFTDGSGTVAFEYLDYRVTVEWDGTIALEPLADSIP